MCLIVLKIKKYKLFYNVNFFMFDSWVMHDQDVF